jgi:hypothetical protein
MTESLPALPNTWADHPDGFRQRWIPGAFGPRETIHDVVAFRVKDADWEERPDGTIWRTIRRAEVLS